MLNSSVTELSCFDSNTKQAIMAEAKRKNFTAAEVDLRGIQTEEELFFLIIDVIPFGSAYRGLHNSINMTALWDVLWSGLYNAGDFCLIVDNAEILVAEQLNLILGLHAVFCSIDNLRKSKGYDGKIKTLLLGKGAAFVLSTE